MADFLVLVVELFILLLLPLFLLYLPIPIGSNRLLLLLSGYTSSKSAIVTVTVNQWLSVSLYVNRLLLQSTPAAQSVQWCVFELNNFLQPPIHWELREVAYISLISLIIWINIANKPQWQSRFSDAFSSW